MWHFQQWTEYGVLGRTGAHAAPPVDPEVDYASGLAISRRHLPAGDCAMENQRNENSAVNMIAFFQVTLGTGEMRVCGNARFVCFIRSILEIGKIPVECDPVYDLMRIDLCSLFHPKYGNVWPLSNSFVVTRGLRLC